MGEGIVVDDGGSTRITWNEEPPGPGRMEDLLDVGKSIRNTSKHSLNSKKNFDQVRIVWQDGIGASHEKLFPLSKTVEIASHMKQRVLLEKVAPSLSITILSDDENIEPIVEARQHEMKRRYIVSNSGPIEKVTIDNKLVYDTASLSLEPYGPVIYTSVVLTNRTDTAGR